MRIEVIQKKNETYKEFKERVELKQQALKLKYKTIVTMSPIGEHRGVTKVKDCLCKFALRVHLKEK